MDCSFKFDILSQKRVVIFHTKILINTDNVATL